MDEEIELEGMSTDEVLLWAVKKFPLRLVQFSSFGPSGLVILSKLANLGVLRDVPTVTIDTLHLFDETYELIKNVSAKYPDMKLHTYFPDGYSAGQHFKFDYMHGDDMWTYQFDQYTYLTKVEPTMRALRELDPLAWITGRRRAQGDERANLRVVEYDEGRLKINPLARWTSKEVWNYIRTSAVPYNRLHDEGYTSIGDRMNTRAVKRGETERAGRFQFAGQEKTTECGMHEHKAKWKAVQEAAKKRKEEFKVPALPCPDCLQLHPETFEHVVLDTREAVLVEFYSPLCGHCQHFGPIYAEVAKAIKGSEHILAARYDLFNYSVPKVAEKAGFNIRGYPSLWLARFDAALGKPRLLEFKGAHSMNAYLRWLKEEIGDTIGSDILGSLSDSL